jgi:type II secretion system protein H
MDFQNKKKLKNSAGQNGFTLLELIVVMVIMSIVMAVLMPRLSEQLMGNSLRSAVSELGTIAASARFRAADTGKQHVVVIDTESSELKLLSGDKSKILSMTLLPPKVTVKDMELLGKSVSGHEMHIIFYPQGTATPARMRLVSEKRESMNLVVAGADGGVYVR